MNKVYDVIVIGGGPAGYTAAMYAARAGLSTLVVERLYAGGQMTQTTQIDNYSGFHEGIDGFTLGMNMEQGALRFGVETVNGEVLSVEPEGAEKQVETDAGRFVGRTLIVATGAGHRHLGVEGEQELTGKGVAYCAACDGMFYRGKRVAVVGGGNSAAADAMVLSRVAEKVYLIHRRDTLRATKIYHDPLLRAENVELLWNSEVTGLLHDGTLTGVRVKDIPTGQERELPLDGLFISVGRTPATELFRGKLELDGQGYIVADETTRTSVPGVYAVGDVRTKTVRQIITAAADGAVAAHYAEEYLLGGASG